MLNKVEEVPKAAAPAPTVAVAPTFASDARLKLHAEVRVPSVEELKAWYGWGV